jgi:uncharacterized protein YcbK (DUF882 family)
MLSKHFSEDELRCRCGRNCLTYVTPELINALEELRELVRQPITITSGYRCINNNAEVGGGKNSMHLVGKAADLKIKNFSVAQMYEAALQIEAFFNGGIGVYPTDGFIHVDVRQGKARWGRIGKGKKAKYVSIDEALKV